MHGCECQDSWQLEGLTLHGCVHTLGIALPWCFVKDPSKCTKGYTKAQLDALQKNVSQSGVVANGTTSTGTWDFCSLHEEVDMHLTHKGCHCLPRWEYKSKVYSGCNITEPNGTGWCYAAETGQKCSKNAAAPGEGKLHEWDTCDLPTAEPKFRTKHGCHCKPKWNHGGKDLTDCTKVADVPPPASLNSTNNTMETSHVGWCEVFTDERGCSGAQIGEKNVLWDTCFIIDEASKSTLQTSVHGCHCLPGWELGGISYKGCVKTPGAKGSWCPVIEDDSTAAGAQALGLTDASDGAGLTGHRWDWCNSDATSDEKNETGHWRPADKRFTPKDPSTPEWYQDVYNGLMEADSNEQELSHQLQASYWNRRRSR